MKRFLVMLLLAFLCAPALAARDKKKKLSPDDIGHSDPGKGVNFYSIEKEIALGKQLAAEVERQAKLVQDPVVAEYINRLCQNLARNSDAQVPFTCKVIDSTEVNAFSLPGGFLFVNTGLILRAGSEAELAGVMAHEIAHVAARHGTKQATRGQLANLASIPLIFLGGWAGYGIRQAAGIAVPMGFLRFSRAMEEQADRLGVEYMYKAGYDPNAFIDFFERLETLEKKKPGTISKIFSSHPPTEARVKRTQAEIQQLEPLPEYVVDTSEFHAVHDRLAMLLRLRKGDLKDDNRPTLLRRTSRNGTNGDDSKDDERPTLKRRN